MPSVALCFCLLGAGPAQGPARALEAAEAGSENPGLQADGQVFYPSADFGASPLTLRDEIHALPLFFASDRFSDTSNSRLREIFRAGQEGVRGAFGAFALAGGLAGGGGGSGFGAALLPDIFLAGSFGVPSPPGGFGVGQGGSGPAGNLSGPGIAASEPQAAPLSGSAPDTPGGGAVPEPGAFLLFALGLAVLGGMGLRATRL